MPFRSKHAARLLSFALVSTWFTLSPPTLVAQETARQSVSPPNYNQGPKYGVGFSAIEYGARRNGLSSEKTAELKEKYSKIAKRCYEESSQIGAGKALGKETLAKKCLAISSVLDSAGVFKNSDSSSEGLQLSKKNDGGKPFVSALDSLDFDCDSSIPFYADALFESCTEVSVASISTLHAVLAAKIDGNWFYIETTASPNYYQIAKDRAVMDGQTFESVYPMPTEKLSFDNYVRISVISHEIEAAISGGNAKLASGRLDELLALKSTSYIALSGAASQLFQIGQYDKTMQVAGKFAKLYPNDSVPFSILASIARKQGKLDEAYSYSSKALDLLSKERPSQDYIVNLIRKVTAAVLHMNRGNLLHFMGDDDGAMRAYAECIKLVPEAGAGYYHTAHRLFESGRYAQAIPYFEKFLKYKDNYSAVLSVEDENELEGSYLNLGVCHMQTGNLDSAKAFVLKAAEINPGFPKAWRNLATIECELKDYEAALRHASRALEIDSNYTRAMITKVRALGNLGRLEETRGILSRLHKVDFGKAANATLRAVVLEVGNDPRSAFNLLNEAAEKDSSICDVPFYYIRGNCAFELGYTATASKCFTAALQAGGDEYLFLYLRATMDISSGYSNSALRDLTAAISINQNYSDAYALRAKIYTRLGMAGEAEDDSRKAASLKSYLGNGFVDSQPMR